jgi:predicted O-linked N-acetylglucosamine transferase (SPINDLY family)
MTDPTRLLESAIAHHRSGRLAEAEDLYRQVLAQQPANPDALHLAGVLHTQRGDPAAGLRLLRQAVSRRPDAPIFHNNLGKALADAGDWAAAMASHERAIALEPRYAEAHYNLGVTLAALGNMAGAEQAYRRVLALAPDDFRARNNLAVVLQGLGRLDEAEAGLRAVLDAQPADAEALVNLGSLYRARGNSTAAAEYYRRALASQPNSAQAQAGLGTAAIGDGDFDGAHAALSRALELAPANSLALLNQAHMLMVLDDFPAAWANYRALLKDQPENMLAQRNRLIAALYDPALDAAGRAAEHQDFGRIMAARVRQPLPPLAPDRSLERRLRVGWLSSDFKGHPVARNLFPIFAGLDRRQFDMVCFAEVPAPDEATERFRAASAAWHSTIGLDDEAVAKLIRSEQIDIMIFLGGRFDNNRPQVAAWRPAPVQISFHDPGTSGLAAMDYLIADPLLAPPRAPEYFTERVLRLPTFYTHAPLTDAPDPGPLPALSAGSIRFGSFNNPLKIGAANLAAWAEILRRVPDARLLMKFHNWFDSNLLRERIRRQLGPDAASRVDFKGARDNSKQHLALYRDVDIALDSFPFTGSTTTFEALSMGVPVVTLAGANMAAGSSASILRGLKLDGLVAWTAEDYVARAVALANDVKRLVELRATLPQRVRTSPLCNGQLRTRQMERMLRAVWRRYAAGVRQ